MISRQSMENMLNSDYESEHSESTIGIGDVDNGDDTSVRSATRNDGDDDVSAREQFTKKESKDIIRVRHLVLFILLVAAGGISAIVFTITRSGEVDEVETQYDGAAQRIIESFDDILIKMGTMSGLAVANSAHSVDHESDWPFVTLSNFQQRARNAMEISKALFVSISPIVTQTDFEKWENFVNGENSYWIKEGFIYQEELNINNFETKVNIEKSSLSKWGVDPMHYVNESGGSVLEDGPGPYLPVWQTSPTLKTKIVNENLLRVPNITEPATICIETGSITLGGFISAPPGTTADPNHYTALFATLRSISEEKNVVYDGDPMSNFFIPVFDAFDQRRRKVVAVMTSIIQWSNYFRRILPKNINGIVVVLENDCHGQFTYEINGDEVYAIGNGDHHDQKFDAWDRQTNFTLDRIKDGTAAGLKFNHGSCKYNVHVYPSQTFFDAYGTRMPYTVTFSILAVFLFVIVIFLFYDRLVDRRQNMVLAKATQSTAIVSSLFPSSVRERLIQGDEHNVLPRGNKGRLKTFMNGSMNENESSDQPIADLFPNCTVLFADISGFTAWSSTRDPPQVFVLLQTIYQSFDALAKRRKVFKVETIGDSYVAVTGLPEPQDQHSVIMARFAWECLLKLNEVVKDLEVSLGPDTGDLSMRFGLHSGPVTAGVLRGDRARFQLFGDTVNTASRMESTGVRGKIQVTQNTSDLLIMAGKSHWLKPREDKVKAKGKGLLTTFFVYPGIKKKGTSTASLSSDVGALTDQTSFMVPRTFKDRFIEWMVEILAEQIKKIVYVRMQCGIAENHTPFVYTRPDGATCLDEVQAIIPMPEFDALVAACMDDNTHSSKIELDENVMTQLREYVNIISSLYKDNPFHNFEHACHVTMSVTKLMKRIVAPDLSDHDYDNLMKKGRKTIATHLHDCTYGMNADPLTMFAVTFSALIHDVDHRGVSNGQLVEEEPEMSAMYRNQSIAEQNSLDVAWDLLMMEQFDDLRSCLFVSQADLMRFRQLIVNVVLATDIFDRELNDLRKSRWERAFPKSSFYNDDFDEEDDKDNTYEETTTHTIADFDADLRATIVMEHIIQASDVSHTMQHWHVYQKWNACLFREMHMAYLSGRMAKEPASFWYKGELGFFDNYIIPLAKKLKECRVFGVSSDEYLNYAEQNRAEWEECGEEIVQELTREVASMSG